MYNNKLLLSQLKKYGKGIILSLLSLSVVLNVAASSTEINNQKYKYDEIYKKWENSVKKQPEFRYSSDNSFAVRLKEFDDIVNIGISGLPFIFSRIEEKEDYFSSVLLIAVDKICKIYLVEDSYKLGDISLFKKYVNWWKSDRFEIENHFVQIYSEWKIYPTDVKLKKGFIVDYAQKYKGDHEGYRNALKSWKKMPAGKEKEQLRPYQRTTYQKMLDLGISALPYAIEKINEGDADLIEAVNYWTDDALKKSAEEKGVTADDMCEYCAEWWEANKEYWLLPPVEESEKK